jgi:hypothetical protein
VFHNASGRQLDLYASKRDVNEHILRSVEHAARVFPDGSNLHAVISAWTGALARCSTAHRLVSLTGGVMVDGMEQDEETPR